MRMPSILIASIGLLLLALSPHAMAIEVGSKVVVVSNADLLDEGKSVVSISRGTQLLVREASSMTLRVDVPDPRLFQSKRTQPKYSAAKKASTAEISKLFVVAVDEAEEFFTSQIDMNSNDAVAYQTRGRLLFEKKNLDAAISDFNQALFLKPANAEVLYLRGNIFLKQGDAEEAFDDFDKVVKLRGNAYQAYAKRGEANYLQDDVQEAHSDYNQALELNKQHRDSLLGRGTCLMEMGNFLAAAKDFEAALRLEPDDLKTMKLLAELWTIQENFAKAEEMCKQIIAKTPKQPDGYLARGRLRAFEKKHKLATESFSKAIELAPNAVEGYLGRAMAWEKLGDYKKLLADYQVCLKLDPSNSMILNNIAWLMATCPEKEYRDGPQAIKFATEALEQDELRAPGTVDTLAAAYAEAGNFEAAVETQQEAIDEAADWGFGDEEIQGMEKRIALYQAKKPYRELPEKEMPDKKESSSS